MSSALAVKFDADIFIQSGVTDIFLFTQPKNPRWRPPPSWSFGYVNFTILAWSPPHGRDASSHKIWCRYLYIQSKVDIFPKSKMAAASTLDFQFMWIWLFRRVGSVVLVLCTKFCSNICHSHWRTYPPDLHLMTSRELTSGFDFWSRGHLCMAMMHLPIKLGADICIQSGIIDIFPKLKMAAAAILDWFGGTWDQPQRCIRGAYSCENFVVIS